ncbi:MAG TPA: PQQ-binding-like beta-propeller repeat protein [Bryobacteraceae bacterium]|nr:PQQ-binding-like beta-propeller repeat protein [Bryobacteraceae bacterium]
MMKHSIAWIAAATCLIPAGAANSSDWPGWRGPHRDDLSSEQGLLKQWHAGGPPLAWQVHGLGAGFSSVAISGDRIYTMGDRADGQYVLALNLADGKTVWATRIGEAWEDANAPGPRGTPTVDGDAIFAIGTDGEVVSLEAATGRMRWQKSMVRDYNGKMMSDWKFSESPLVDGDRLIFTPGSFGALLAAVDKRSGKEIWRAEGGARVGNAGSNGAGYSSMVISEGAGVRQYVQLAGRGLFGVNAENGKILWSYNRIANDVANIPTPVVKGDYVFASTGYGTGSVLLKLERSGDGVAAKEVYFLDAKTFQNHHGGFVLLGDYIYGGQGHNNGFPICLEFLSGKVRWGGDIRPEGSSGSAAVAYADGHLYFRYQNGVMKLIEATPEGYKETGTFHIPGVKLPSWSHPVILDGKLYLREQDTLLCYNVRG